MVPVVYHGTALGVEYVGGGSQTIELDSLSDKEKRAARSLVERTDKLFTKQHKGTPGARGVMPSTHADTREIGKYLENPNFLIDRATIIEGWIGYATMPGYLDRTDPEIFDTEAEAMTHAREAAGEDEDDQPSTLGGKVRS